MLWQVESTAYPVKQNDRVGTYGDAIGDVDGDGVPDVYLSSPQGYGGGFVILLNSDGTAKSVVEIRDGKNGVPSGFFASSGRAGFYSGNRNVDMDGDGVPDLFIGNEFRFSVFLMLLNRDGTVKRAIKYQPGVNGVPSAVGELSAWCLPSVIGDVDGNGVPDVFVGAHHSDHFKGGGCVILLNPDLTAKTAVRLTNGYNGVPSDYFSGMTGLTVYPLGDFDGDGVPDVLLGASRLRDVDGIDGGGAIIMLLNADGTAKELVKLASGMSGIPAGMFRSGDEVRAAAVLGDVDGDGVTDLMLSGPNHYTVGNVGKGGGVYYLALLNPDGTVKTLTRIANGEGGMPDGQMTSSAWYVARGAALGDVNGDGITDFAAGVPIDRNIGSLCVIMPGIIPPSNGAQSVGFGGTNVVERPLHLTTANEVVAWDKFVAEADIPAGTTLAYSIGRVVGNDFVYDLGSTFTDIPAPVPLDGLDISGLSPEYQDLVVRITYTGSTAPTIRKVYATYLTDTWQSFTFTVRVDDPVAAGVLPDINNTVTITDNKDDHSVDPTVTPASISGYVWHDENYDKVFNDHEKGIPGVTITLTGTDALGNPVHATTTTDEDGYYNFIGLFPGVYTITETQPDGYISTTGLLGTVGGETRGTNVDILDDILAEITLNAGVRGVRYDFGEVFENTEPSIQLIKEGRYIPGAPGTACQWLYFATNFNAFIFGDLYTSGGDTEYRLAVGGSASFTGGYSVGQPVYGKPLPVYTDGTTDMLIVGGDLYDGYFGVNGNIVYGGTRYGPYRYMPDGNLVYQATNITFDASGNVSRDGTGQTWLDLYERIVTASAQMAALGERGVVTNDFTQPHFGYLTGNDPWLNVFHVDAADWSMSQSDYIIEAPADSVVLVNIHGDDVSITYGAMRLVGIEPDHVIFNYVDATNIVVESFTHSGSVVAPYASAQLHGGSIDGAAILGGDVVTGRGFEFHNFGFGAYCLGAGEGATIEYTFTVINDGGVPLHDITIDDPLVEVTGGPITVLQPGETNSTTFTATYTLTPADFLAGFVTNTATASGIAVTGDIVSDTDSETVIFRGTGPFGTTVDEAEEGEEVSGDAGENGTGATGETGTGEAGDTGDAGGTEPATGVGDGTGTGETGATDGTGAGTGTGGAGAAAEPPSYVRADFGVTAIEFVGPAPTVTGEVFEIRFTVENRGQIAGDAGNAGIFISHANPVSIGEVPDALVEIGMMQPGEIRVVEIGGLAAAMTRGTHHVRVYADMDDVTREWSEGDNQLPLAYTISPIRLAVTFDTAAGGLRLIWNSYWGDRYIVYRTTDLRQPFEPIATVDATYPENTFVDPNPPAGGAFYKIGVLLP